MRLQPKLHSCWDRLSETLQARAFLVGRDVHRQHHDLGAAAANPEPLLFKVLNLISAQARLVGRDVHRQHHDLDGHQALQHQHERELRDRPGLRAQAGQAVRRQPAHQRVQAHERRACARVASMISPQRLADFEVHGRGCSLAGMRRQPVHQDNKALKLMQLQCCNQHCNACNQRSSGHFTISVIAHSSSLMHNWTSGHDAVIRELRLPTASNHDSLLPQWQAPERQPTVTIRTARFSAVRCSKRSSLEIEFRAEGVPAVT